MAGALSERLSGVRFENESDHGSRLPNQAAAESARTAARANDIAQIKTRIQHQLIAELGPEANLSSSDGRREVEALLNQLVEAEGLTLPRMERTRLLEAVIADVLAYGPIEPLLRDPSVSEIMVNGPRQVWVERRGV